MKYFFSIFCLVLTGLFVGFSVYLNWDVEFSSKKWGSAGLIEKYRMSLDIEEHNTLIGKSREEVINLLGVPSSENDSEMFYRVDQPWGYKDGFTHRIESGKVAASYLHD